MRFVPTLFLLAMPVIVSACEGDCIVGITNAWLGNYTSPINLVMDSMAKQMSDLIPGHPSPETTRNFLKPVMDAYSKQAYQGMETAIFPSYFHGKCLDSNGVEPFGCPNPDCPIVCGTPGSLVHFYPKLRYIAFNETAHHLQALCTPGTDAYQQVEKLVLEASSKPSRQTKLEQERRGYSRVFARGVGGVPVNAMENNQKHAVSVAPPPPVASAPVPIVHQGSSMANPGANSYAGASGGATAGNNLLSALIPGGSASKSSGLGLPGLKPRSPDVKAGLKSIMQQTRTLLEEVCGGTAETTNGLPGCDWEDTMKAYILTFP